MWLGAFAILLLIWLVVDANAQLSPGFDSDVMNTAPNANTGTYSQQVQDIAYAIAVAERGQTEIDSGSIARNNPGDIKGSDGNFVVYPTLQDGWNALYHQVSLIVDGGSHIYTADMSIAQVAAHYTATQQDAWAANVATVLGVTPDTPIGEAA